MLRKTCFSSALSLCLFTACTPDQEATLLPAAQAPQTSLKSSLKRELPKIKIEPGSKAGHAQIKVQLSAPTQTFKAQNVSSSLFYQVYAEINGSEIAAPIYADNADTNGFVSETDASFSLQFSNVPYGALRTLQVRFETEAASAETPIIGSAFTLNSTTTEIPLDFSTTPLYRIATAWLQEPLEEKSKITQAQLNNLQSFLNTLSGKNGSFPNYVYSTHPSLINTAQIINDLQSNHWDISALDSNNLHYKIEPGILTGNISGLVSTDTVNLRVTDESSQILNNQINGAYSVDNIRPYLANHYLPHLIVQGMGGTSYTANFSPSSEVSPSPGQTQTLDITMVPAKPSISHLSASTAIAGSPIRIHGNNFHNLPTGNTVRFGGFMIPQSDIQVLSPQELEVKVPSGNNGNVNLRVNVGTQPSNNMPFTLQPLNYFLQSIANDTRAEFFQDMEIVGNLAYAIDVNPLLQSNSGLRILDLSNPDVPVQVGYFNTPGWIKDVKVQGNHAYIADERAGLLVIDISTPSAPYLVTQLDTTEPALKLALQNNILVLAKQNTISIFDISTPTAPVAVGNINRSGVNQMHIANDILYVLTNSLESYDIGDLSNPSLLDSTSGGKDMVFQGNLALIATGGLRVVDITDPSNLQILRSGGSGIDTLDVSGNYVYGVSLSGGTLRSFDFTQSPITLSDQSNITIADDEATNIKIVGSRAYVTYDGGIEVFNISNPNQLTSLYNYDPTGEAWDMKVKDNTMFVASRDSLVVYDVSNPGVPIHLSTLPLAPYSAKQISISGNYAFVYGTSLPYSFQMIDVSDPGNPSLLSSFATENAPGESNIITYGQYVYLANKTQGVEIWDISNPHSPSLVHKYGNAARNVAIENDTLYVLTGSYLEISDLSTPSHPVLLGSTPCTAVKGLNVSGNYAYTLAGHVFDVSNPSAPTFADGFSTNNGDNLSISSNRAYIGNETDLKILDISDPTNVVSDVTINVSQYALRTHPNYPVQIGPYDFKSMFVKDNYAYIADTINGVLILKLYE